MGWCLCLNLDGIVCSYAIWLTVFTMHMYACIHKYMQTNSRIHTANYTNTHTCTHHVRALTRTSAHARTYSRTTTLTLTPTHTHIHTQPHTSLLVQRNVRPWSLLLSSQLGQPLSLIRAWWYQPAQTETQCSMRDTVCNDNNLPKQRLSAQW